MSTAFIHTRDLAINNRILHTQVLADPLRQILEVAERVSVAGHKVALAVLDVGEGTKAIDLQLENVIVGIEGYRATVKAGA